MNGTQCSKCNQIFATSHRFYIFFRFLFLSLAFDMLLNLWFVFVCDVINRHNYCSWNLRWHFFFSLWTDQTVTQYLNVATHQTFTNLSDYSLFSEFSNCNLTLFPLWQIEHYFRCTLDVVHGIFDGRDLFRSKIQ